MLLHHENIFLYCISNIPLLNCVSLMPNFVIFFTQDIVKLSNHRGALLYVELCREKNSGKNARG